MSEIYLCIVFFKIFSGFFHLEKKHTIRYKGHLLNGLGIASGILFIERVTFGIWNLEFGMWNFV